MKTKLTTAIVFIGIAYLVPIFPKWELLYEPQYWVLILASLLILFSQPAIEAREVKREKKADGFSAWFIMLSGLLSQIMCTLDWVHLQQGKLPALYSLEAIIGATLIIGGIIFRLWSINTLGNYFTTIVKIQGKHQLIDYGPYKILRHPSYTGAFISIVGGCIWIGAYVALIPSIVFLLIAYHYRIAKEESALIAALGEPYKAYQKKTFKMFPWVY